MRLEYDETLKDKYNSNACLRLPARWDIRQPRDRCGKATVTRTPSFRSATWRTPKGGDAKPLAERGLWGVEPTSLVASQATASRESVSQGTETVFVTRTGTSPPRRLSLLGQRKIPMEPEGRRSESWPCAICKPPTPATSSIQSDNTGSGNISRRLLQLQHGVRHTRKPELSVRGTLEPEVRSAGNTAANPSQGHKSMLRRRFIPLVLVLQSRSLQQGRRIWQSKLPTPTPTRSNSDVWNPERCGRTADNRFRLQVPDAASETANAAATVTMYRMTFFKAPSSSESLNETSTFPAKTFSPAVPPWSTGPSPTTTTKSLRHPHGGGSDIHRQHRCPNGDGISADPRIAGYSGTDATTAAAPAAAAINAGGTEDPIVQPRHGNHLRGWRDHVAVERYGRRQCVYQPRLRRCSGQWKQECVVGLPDHVPNHGPKLGWFG